MNMSNYSASVIRNTLLNYLINRTLNDLIVPLTCLPFTQIRTHMLLFLVSIPNLRINVHFRTLPGKAKAQ